MSIIGRLDDQVDAVIIAPVAKRRAAEEADGRHGEEAFSPGMAAPLEEIAPEREKNHREETAGSTEREALPVWLL